MADDTLRDPRWTDETESLVWKAAKQATEGDVRRILAALADAGLLLPAGGETRTEWSAEPSLTPRYVTGPIESDREVVCPMRYPEQAMRDYIRGMRNRPAIVSRIVHTGPWLPADQSGEHRG